MSLKTHTISFEAHIKHKREYFENNCYFIPFSLSISQDKYVVSTNVLFGEFMRRIFASLLEGFRELFDLIRDVRQENENRNYNYHPP